MMAVVMFWLVISPFVGLFVAMVIADLVVDAWR